MQGTLFTWNFNFNQMKKLIYLFLMLFASVAYSQADFPEGVQISGGQPTTTTDPYITTTGSTGLQGKVPPINMPVTITPPTTFYTPVTSDLKGHLQGIDNALGDIPLTTAGNTTRVWFTGDATTITAGTFYLTNAQNKGTVENVSQSVTNDDNQKKYFTQDLIGNAFATTTIFPPGVYAGNLSASTTPNSAQQRFTVELYRCDTNGTPIASGIAGAPVGDLGVTVILILDSGLLTLADGSVTNVQVSASLASQLTINVGERIRYHVSAEKVGTVASNITESVWYGNSFNSYIDVPTPITSSGVSNLSTVTGATVTTALDNLNVSLTGKENVDNKATDFSTVNNTLYPTVQAVSEGIIYKRTVAQIRALTGPLPSSHFFTTDIGKEGEWFYDSSDVSSLDNNGTILVTADGKRIKRIYNNKELNITWFGAIGDGILNNGFYINDAISVASALGGGTVLVPEGTFLTRFAINLKPNVTIKGTSKRGGSKIKIADKIEYFMTANANAGQKNITLSSTVDLFVGQDITIFDNTHNTYGGGDSNRIASINVSTNTITLEANLKFSYTVANAGKVFTTFSAFLAHRISYSDGFGLPFPVEGYTNVTIENLDIDGNSANNTQGNYDEVQAGINLANSHFMTIKNCYIHDFRLGGIVSSHYIDGSFDGSENVLINNNRIENVGFKDAIHLHGIKKSTISNNYVKNSNDYSIYIIAANDNVFKNNRIYGGGYGYQIIDCLRNFINGDEINGATTGINITTASLSTANINVSNCNILNSTGISILSTNTPTYINLINNTISSNNDGGIQLYAAHSSIIGNSISSTGGNSCIYSAGNNSIIADNIIQKTGFGNGIDNYGNKSNISNNVIEGNRPAINNFANDVIINGNNMATSGTSITNSGLRVDIVSNTNNSTAINNAFNAYLEVKNDIITNGLNSTINFSNGGGVSFSSIGFNNTTNDLEIKQKYTDGGIKFFTNTATEGMYINATGVVKIPDLSGTGTRTVVADASGNLSATSTTPTSGTYTPTYTNTANVSSFTHQRAFYSVVDKVVHVTIKLVANVTSATASTAFEVTTPSTRSSSSFVLVTGSARGDLIAPVMTTGDTTTSAFVELKPPAGSTATAISVILNMSYEIP